MINEGGGFVKLYKSLINWEWYGDKIVLAVFIHCLLLANYKEKKWKGEIIPRGSFITSREEFARSAKLTEQQVRTAWKKLENSNDISKKSTNRFTQITVINWDKYQPHLEDTNQQLTNNQPTNNQQLTNNQPTNNQQLTTTKNIKNIKEDKEYKEIKRKMMNDINTICNSFGFNSLSTEQVEVVQSVWLENLEVQEIQALVNKAKAYAPTNLFTYVNSMVNKQIELKKVMPNNPEGIQLVDYNWWEED